MIERDTITTLARKFEIDEYSILREYLQILILRDLYHLTESTNVYFKGGTAIRLLLHSFRFSEDLDFTASVSKKKIKTMVQTAVETSNLEAPGLVLELLSEMPNSLTHRIKFPTELSIHPLTIKLEFSFRENPLTRKTSLIDTELPISPYPMVVHFDFEEILAEKVRAILTRNQGRDIFDCWFLLSKGIKINTKFIKKKMSYYKKKFNIDGFKKTVAEIPTQALKDDLQKFLPRSHRKMIGDLKTLLLKKIEGVT
jgi:predicted nucleotidyltransferase component of viral defense system